MVKSGARNGIQSAAAKVFTLLTVFIYLLLSIGVIKATHFCMGSESSVALFTAEAEKCPCSLHGDKRDPCCDDRHELLRIENEQKILTPPVVAKPSWIVLEADSPPERSPGEGSPGMTTYAGHPVPDKIPRWKIHCSFLFYDDGPRG